MAKANFEVYKATENWRLCWVFNGEQGADVGDFYLDNLDIMCGDVTRENDPPPPDRFSDLTLEDIQAMNVDIWLRAYGYNWSKEAAVFVFRTKTEALAAKRVANQIAKWKTVHWLPAYAIEAFARGFKTTEEWASSVSEWTEIPDRFIQYDPGYE